MKSMIETLLLDDIDRHLMGEYKRTKRHLKHNINLECQHMVTYSVTLVCCSKRRIFFIAAFFVSIS